MNTWKTLFILFPFMNQYEPVLSWFSMVLFVFQMFLAPLPVASRVSPSHVAPSQVMGLAMGRGVSQGAWVGQEMAEAHVLVRKNRAVKDSPSPKSKEHLLLMFPLKHHGRGQTTLQAESSCLDLLQEIFQQAEDSFDRLALQAALFEAKHHNIRCDRSSGMSIPYHCPAMSSSGEQ